MRVPELDLFRFIAALSVVFYHYIAWFAAAPQYQDTTVSAMFSVAQYGFLGVPLFFMISGFVILASAMQRSSLEFAASRAARLYPVYWFCVTLTALVFLLVEHKLEVVNMVGYLLNLTMLNTFLRVDSIDGVYWTLAKEIQFYFCVFVLMCFGLLKHIKVWIGGWLICTAIYLAFKQPFFMGWFISPEYSAFFIAGICCYMIYQSESVRYFSGCLVAATMLACYSIYRESAGFLPDSTETNQIVSAIIVAAMVLVFWAVSARKIGLKGSKLLITLGALTYPLYLLHNELGKILLERFEGTFGAMLNLTIVTVIMLIASYLVVKYVEQKIASPMKKFLLALTKQIQAPQLFKKSN